VARVRSQAGVFRGFQYPTPPLAVYPAEAIEAHRAFIARRRATRPGEEYRTPTEEEWDAFLAHFEKRKVSVGTCARAFASPCVHEHAGRQVLALAKAALMAPADALAWLHR
jgi:hypothetical protein